MPKIAVMTPEKAPAEDSVQTYYGDANSPLHLLVHAVAPGETLRIDGGDIDRLAYVWRGSVVAGGVALPQGSSLIVEHGRALEITGGDEPTKVLTFAAARPPAQPRSGGHVHLLPTDRVSRVAPEAASGGTAGGMHFDASLPSNEIWLHENHFPPMPEPEPGDQRGVHSHSEDEIIFVTDGAIRLGAKLYGPGTAVAIAADTLYSFTSGPEGLSFVNFRAGLPGDIQFANGMSISETGYWKDRVVRPDYIAA